MKRLFVFISLLLIATGSSVLAQSHPQINTSDSKKVNQRPSPTPTPKSEEPEPIGTIQDGDVLRVDTNLVSIPVKVLNKSGNFMAGLKKENFQIFEDNIEQEIAYFSNIEESFTVVLLIDMSYSTIFKTSEIQSAANGFVAQLRPNDKVMVVSFDEEVHLLCNPTTNREEIWNAIKSTKIGEGTSLYEAVDFVINKKIPQIEGRKAIVLFTDGVDTTSRAAYFEKNVRDAEELEAIIYPIQYDTYNDVNKTPAIPLGLPNPTGGGTPSSTRIPSQTGSPFPFPFPTGSTNPRNSPSVIGTGTSPQEYETANKFLHELADETGGRVLPASNKTSMALAFSNIADELRQTYSIGFYPNEIKKEKKRKIKVKVDQKGAIVRARESYTVKEKMAK